MPINAGQAEVAPAGSPWVFGGDAGIYRNAPGLEDNARIAVNGVGAVPTTPFGSQALYISGIATALASCPEVERVFTTCLFDWRDSSSSTAFSKLRSFEMAREKTREEHRVAEWRDAHGRDAGPLRRNAAIRHHEMSSEEAVTSWKSNG